jgi:hypothetical protein
MSIAAAGSMVGIADVDWPESKTTLLAFASLVYV